MSLYQPETIPNSAQSMPEVNARIARWYTEGMLTSAAPEIIGTIDDEQALMPLISTQRFRTVYGARILLAANGNLVDHISDNTESSSVRDTMEVMELLSPIFQAINSDARQFASIPDEAALSASFDLMSGSYLTSSETDAHIDPCFGLGYFACIGASTEFIPGYFDKPDIKAVQKDGGIFPHVSFDSGTIVRADETMLHRAPILQKSASRLLVRCVINDVRKY
jgi:hypothetical protein